MRLIEKGYDIDDEWRLSLGKPEAQAAAPSLMLRGSDWARTKSPSAPKGQWTATEWYIQCNLYGLEMLERVVEIDPHRRGGVPVLRGTRFTVAQVLAELSETACIDEIAENFDLDAGMIRALLDGLSLLLQRPTTSMLLERPYDE